MISLRPQTGAAGTDSFHRQRAVAPLENSVPLVSGSKALWSVSALVFPGQQQGKRRVNGRGVSAFIAVPKLDFRGQ